MAADAGPAGEGLLRRPNFAFDLTARRATDAEVASLDLSGVIGIINGAERIHPSTLVRFNERFRSVGFRPEMVLPSYGLAGRPSSSPAAAMAGLLKSSNSTPSN